MTTPQQSQVGGQDAAMPQALLDEHLDAVLRASGSALKFYSLQGVIDNMRASMRMFEESVLARHAQAAAPQEAEADLYAGFGVGPSDDRIDALTLSLTEATAWAEARGGGNKVFPLYAAPPSAPTQAAAPGVQGWRPIETAPKDQEIVGAEWQSPGGDYPLELMVSATTYQDGAWRYPSGIAWEPTHWVPRLSPPLPEPQPEEDEPEATICPSCDGTGIEGIDRGESRMPSCWSCKGSGSLPASPSLPSQEGQHG